MRRVYIMLIVIGLTGVAACRAGDGAGTRATEPGGATATAPTMATDGYPAQPTPASLPDDYPAAQTPAATAQPTAYPADKEVWVLRPLGQQCVDPETYEYEDLDAAVEALEEAGVDVLASEEVSRPVCQSCDCSTSEHFRLQVRAQDLALVQSMGWIQE